MLVRYKLKYTKQDRHSNQYWNPGDVKNVAPELAAKLLTFGDTWEKADDQGEAQAGKEIQPVKREKLAEEPTPVVDFHAMDATKLRDFAEKNYNQKFPKTITVEDLRFKVIGLFTKHNSEAGDAIDVSRGH